jgi:hypothetical protein
VALYHCFNQASTVEKAALLLRPYQTPELISSNDKYSRYLVLFSGSGDG